MKRFFPIVISILITFSLLSASEREFGKMLNKSAEMISLGDYNQATHGLKRLIHISTDKNILMSSYFLLGYVEYRKENYDSSISNFRFSLKYAFDETNRSVIYLWIAKSFYQINLLDSSEIYFSKIKNNLPIKGLYSETYFYESLLKFKEAKVDSALSILSKIFYRSPPKWILNNLYYAYAYLAHFKYPRPVTNRIIDSLLEIDKTKKIYMLKGYFEIEDSSFTEAESSLKESLKNKNCQFAKYTYTLLLWDLIYQNKFSEVTKLYNDTMDIPEYNESILFLYGYSLEKIRNYTKAINVFNNLIELYPQSRYVPYALFFKGLSLINIKSYKLALNLFENFESVYPKYHNLYYYSRYYHAYTLYNLGQYNDALKIFESIIKKSSDFKEKDRTYYMIAKCYQNLKLYKDAIVNFKVILDSFPNSPNIDYAKYNMATLNYMMKKYRTALKQFESLSMGNKLPKNINENIYFYIEKCHFKLGKYKNIIEMAIAFVKKYPHMDKSRELISEIDLYYRNRGNIKQLINFYSYMIDSTSQLSDKSYYIRTLAEIYADIGYYESSLNYYNKLEFKTFDDNLKIADLLIKLKRYNNAIQILRKMLADYPSSQYYNKILFNISRCYSGIGEYQESENILNKIAVSYDSLKIDTFYVNTIISLSDLYAKNGKITDAESLLSNTAEKVRIMKYMLYIKLADLYYSEDKYDEAIKAAKKATLYINQDVNKLSLAYFFVAKCYIKLGDTDEALQKLDEAQLLTKDQSLLNKIVILKDKIKKGKL